MPTPVRLQAPIAHMQLRWTTGGPEIDRNRDGETTTEDRYAPLATTGIAPEFSLLITRAQPGQGGGQGGPLGGRALTLSGWRGGRTRRLHERRRAGTHLLASTGGQVSKFMRSRQGFTLVELMIAVVVLAIIASIAVPSYRSYVLRAQRTDATSALLRHTNCEEKFFLQNPQVGYTNDFGPAGLRMAAAPSATVPSENGHYTVQITIPDPTPGATPLSFLVTATPTPGGAQVNDTHCTTFTLNSDGVRSSSPSPVAMCWK